MNSTKSNINVERTVSTNSLMYFTYSDNEGDNLEAIQSHTGASMPPINKP